MAKKSKASKKVEGTVVTIEFATGETLTADLATFSDDINTRLAVHGLSQKLGDSYAGAEEGEAFACAERVFEDLKAGNWSTRVAAGGPRTTQLAEALAAVANVTLEQAVAHLEEMDDDKKKALRGHPQIKAKLAQIKAEAAAKAAEKAQAEAGEAVPLEL